MLSGFVDALAAIASPTPTALKEHQNITFLYFSRPVASTKANFSA